MSIANNKMLQCVSSETIQLAYWTITGSYLLFEDINTLYSNNKGLFHFSRFLVLTVFLDLFDLERRFIRRRMHNIIFWIRILGLKPGTVKDDPLKWMSKRFYIVCYCMILVFYRFLKF